DGRLEMDNNRAERSIKPFVIGRKNWLFSNTIKGAKSSAIIYSIAETAKENGLNPFNYLKYLFEQLPNIDFTDKEKLDQLLAYSTRIPVECRVPNKARYIITIVLIKCIGVDYFPLTNLSKKI